MKKIVAVLAVLALVLSACAVPVFATQRAMIQTIWMNPCPCSYGSTINVDVVFQTYQPFTTLFFRTYDRVTGQKIAETSPMLEANPDTYRVDLFDLPMQPRHWDIRFELWIWDGYGWTMDDERQYLIPCCSLFSAEIDHVESPTPIRGSPLTISVYYKDSSVPVELEPLVYVDVINFDTGELRYSSFGLPTLLRGSAACHEHCNVGIVPYVDVWRLEVRLYVYYYDAPTQSYYGIIFDTQVLTYNLNQGGGGGGGGQPPRPLSVGVSI